MVIKQFRVPDFDLVSLNKGCMLVSISGSRLWHIS